MMPIVTSPANPKIKQIRKLRDRKEREQSSRFFIEGLRIVGEAVQMKADLDTILFAPELLTSEFGRNLVASQEKAGVPVMEVSAEVFHSLSQKEGPQGIGAVVRQRWEDLNSLSLSDGEFWVALDSAADPGNVGTIMRTNDAVGGAGIILLDRSTDPYDPTALRASMGSVFSQRFVKAAFPEFASWIRARQYPLIGTSGAAAQDYHFVHYPDTMVLLMGSEREGLSEEYMQLCDHLVAIPMIGRSDSLNLAVATGVVLYEIFNDRRDRAGHPERSSTITNHPSRGSKGEEE